MEPVTHTEHDSDSPDVFSKLSRSDSPMPVTYNNNDSNSATASLLNDYDHRHYLFPLHIQRNFPFGIRDSEDEDPDQVMSEDEDDDTTPEDEQVARIRFAPWLQRDTCLQILQTDERCYSWRSSPEDTNSAIRHVKRRFAQLEADIAAICRWCPDPEEGSPFVEISTEAPESLPRSVVEQLKYVLQYSAPTFAHAYRTVEQMSSASPHRSLRGQVLRSVISLTLVYSHIKWLDDLIHEEVDPIDSVVAQQSAPENRDWIVRPCVHHRHLVEVINFLDHHEKRHGVIERMSDQYDALAGKVTGILLSDALRESTQEAMNLETGLTAPEKMWIFETVHGASKIELLVFGDDDGLGEGDLLLDSTAADSRSH